MKQKGQTLGERIRRIRGETHQGEFGKRLGVSQGTVSAWERNDKNRPPSADMYFRLATLASLADDQAFFLQKAGLTGETILSAAERIFADRSAPPSKGEIFRVPIVRHTSKGTEETGELFPVAASLVEHEASTVCLSVDKNSATPSVLSGDLIVLDTSQCDAKDLGPFLDQRALLDLGPPQEPILRGTGYHGLCIGQVRRRVLPDDLGGGLEFPFYVAIATLLPFGAPQSRLEGGIMELTIGHAYSPPRIPMTAEEEAASRAEARIRAIPLFPPLKILGCVIDWIRPPAVKVKEQGRIKRNPDLRNASPVPEPNDEDRLMPARDAAKILAVPESRLRQWRRSVSSRGPSFVRVGGGVRYRLRDLREYLAARTTVRTPSSGRFYRKTKIELLGEKHPGLRDFVEEQQRRRVRHRQIAAALLERWNERVSDQVLSNFYRLRVWPKECKEEREAKAEKRG